MTNSVGSATVTPHTLLTQVPDASQDRPQLEEAVLVPASGLLHVVPRLGDRAPAVACVRGDEVAHEPAAIVPVAISNN
jgi:hypothetical protein